MNKHIFFNIWYDLTENSKAKNRYKECNNPLDWWEEVKDVPIKRNYTSNHQIYQKIAKS